jgi:putative nucleotidyltransferase with HDIG domain
MDIPGIDTCVALMERYAMLPNIRRHSLLVARIADLLATRLQDNVQGQPPVRQLCVSGALLHDIAKTPCLKDACDHAETGAAICAQHGYPEIAEIVAGHVMLNDFSLEQYKQGIFQAREIVYYADKRVRHDAIVSLSERLDYIIENYGKNDDRLHGLIRENFGKCEQLEGFLFNFLDFSPEELARQINIHPNRL